MVRYWQKPDNYSKGSPFMSDVVLSASLQKALQSVQALKQAAQLDQAAVQLVKIATDQVKADAEAAAVTATRGNKVNIVT
jgi:hypothetical protein